MSTRTTNPPLPNIPTVFSPNVNLFKKLTNQHACCCCCGVKFRAISFSPLLFLRCVSGVHDYFVFTFNAFLCSPLSTIVLFVCLSLFELRLLISVLVSLKLFILHYVCNCCGCEMYISTPSSVSHTENTSLYLETHRINVIIQYIINS